jgi:hypothetical protein
MELNENQTFNERGLESISREVFYKEAVDYLLAWYSSSKELQLALNEYIVNKVDIVAKKDLVKIMSYQLESSKILYSTVALLDKMIRITDEEKKKFQLSQTVGSSTSEHITRQ